MRSSRVMLHSTPGPLQAIPAIVLQLPPWPELAAWTCRLGAHSAPAPCWGPGCEPSGRHTPSCSRRFTAWPCSMLACSSGCPGCGPSAGLWAWPAPPAQSSCRCTGARTWSSRPAAPTSSSLLLRWAREPHAWCSAPSLSRQCWTVQCLGALCCKPWQLWAGLTPRAATAWTVIAHGRLWTSIASQLCTCCRKSSSAAAASCDRRTAWVPRC